MHLGLAESGDAALALFARKRTHNRAGVTIPSQIRYVRYYSLLRATMAERGLRSTSGLDFKPTRLDVVRLHGAPKDVAASSGAVYARVLKMNGELVAASSPAPHATWAPAGFVDLELNAECVGDVCVQLRAVTGAAARDTLVAQAWFNSHFIMLATMRLTRSQLDGVHKASSAARVPKNFELEVSQSRSVVVCSRIPCISRLRRRHVTAVSSP